MLQKTRLFQVVETKFLLIMWSKLQKNRECELLVCTGNCRRTSRVLWRLERGRIKFKSGFSKFNVKLLIKNLVLKGNEPVFINKILIIKEFWAVVLFWDETAKRNSHGRPTFCPAVPHLNKREHSTVEHLVSGSNKIGVIKNITIMKRVQLLSSSLLSILPKESKKLPREAKCALIDQRNMKKLKISSNESNLYI